MRRLLPVLLLIGSLAAFTPMAQATVTLGSAAFVDPYGNTDNNYDAYTDASGNIYLAHSADTSGIVVVDVSTDGGDTWTSKITGETIAGLKGGAAGPFDTFKVLAKDPTHIVVITGGAIGSGAVSAIQTTDGSTWTKVTIFTSVGGPAGYSLGVDYLEDNDGYYVAFTECSTAPICGSGTGTIRVARSTDTGASWTLNTVKTATCSTQTCEGVFGIDVRVTDAATWQVVYSGRTTTTNGRIMLTTTTNTGAAWSSPVQQNDFVTPLTDYGNFVSFIHESTEITFSTGGYYHGVLGGAASSFDRFFTGTNLGSVAEGYICTGKNLYVYQGASGSDKTTIYDSSDASNTAVTGTTTTAYSPWATTLRGNDLFVFYPDASTARPVVKKSTDGCPGAASTYTGIFCSASGNPDFGFNLVEDTTLETDYSGSLNSDTDSIELPAYVLRSHTDDFAYLAKGWDGGTRIVSSYFTIEAQRDSQSSVFRSAFTVGVGTPDATTKGNGLDTQHFSGHIEAYFTEVGNDWNVKIYHVNVGNGVTSLTQLGTAFVGDSPNTPTHYNFTLDTTTRKAFVKHFNTEGNETDLFPGGIDLPAYWYSQFFNAHYFVGSGVAVEGTNYSHTNLDTGVGDLSSTCIFSGDGTNDSTPTGDPGRTPPPAADLGNQTALTPETDVGGGEGGLFFNLDEQLFMGALLIFGVVWMGVRQGAPGAAIGALFLIGLILGYSIGWIPLWVMLVIFVISLAAVWFLPKPSNSGVGLT